MRAPRMLRLQNGGEQGANYKVEVIHRKRKLDGGGNGDVRAFGDCFVCGARRGETVDGL